jgi:cytosine/adenosine deaminase-related metal-dependent hydrolase
MFFCRRYALQRAFFPNTGKFETGADADITVLDYIPPTEISIDNLVAHLIFGAKNANAFMTICGGKILFENGAIQFADENAIMRDASKISKKLFEKFKANN